MISIGWEFCFCPIAASCTADVSAGSQAVAFWPGWMTVSPNGRGLTLTCVAELLVWITCWVSHQPHLVVRLLECFGRLQGCAGTGGTKQPLSTSSWRRPCLLVSGHVCDASERSQRFFSSSGQYSFAMYMLSSVIKFRWPVCLSSWCM